MNFRYCLALLILLASVARAAEQPASVTLGVDLPATKVLPGVPFDVLITITNVAEYRVAVGRNAIVSIGSGGQLTPYPEQARLGCFGVSDNSANIELEPHQSRIAYVSWTANWFGNDAGVTGPGTYQLQLALVGDADDVNDGVVFIGEVRTPIATIVRIKPDGEDAVVWNQLRQSTDGAWSSRGFLAGHLGQSLANWVIDHHATSSYYPYAVVLSRRMPQLNCFDTAVSRFGDSPAYAHVLARASMAACSLAEMAGVRHGQPEAEHYFNVALTYSQRAVDAHSEPVRGEALAVRAAAESGIERLHRAPGK